MEVTHHFVNINRHLEQTPVIRPGILDDLPHDVIQRQPGERWVVAHDAIRMDQPIAWAHHKQEQDVLIPLFPYLLAPEPARALSYMMQLGMRVSFDVGRPIKRLHLAIGNPVIDAASEQIGRGWQYWAGFGLLLQ